MRCERLDLHISVNPISLLSFPTGLTPSVCFLGNRLSWILQSLTMVKAMKALHKIRHFQYYFQFQNYCNVAKIYCHFYNIVYLYIIHYATIIASSFSLLRKILSIMPSLLSLLSLSVSFVWILNSLSSTYPPLINPRNFS